MTLFIFLFFFLLFLLHLFSHLCHIFMFTFLAVRLLILHVFSLFSSFFLFPCFPLLMFASRYDYLLSLSLSYVSSVYSFKKITFIYFLIFFSFVHPFLQNCFCSISFVVSHLFSHLFFSIVFFRTREIDPFFFWQKNNLFNPSKNFSEILSFDFFFFKKKIFHRFSFCF